MNINKTQDTEREEEVESFKMQCLHLSTSSRWSLGSRLNDLPGMYLKLSRSVL